MPPISIKHHSTADSIKYLGTVLVIGGGIGLLVSVVCSLFVVSVQWLIDNRNGFFDEFLMLPGTELTLMPALWLTVAALLLFVVRKVFKIDRWHGPADSIYAAHRTDNELDIKAGIGSTLAAFISLGGGAPVGQYGPLVHFGASIGSHLSVNFGGRRITADIFIGCGVAAAIAAGFHAPIAGIVFAHEAVLRHFSFRAVTPIAISSITSAWFSSAVFGGQPIFQIDFILPSLLPMVPALLASGVFFGLVAILFMKLLFAGGKLAAGTRLKPLQLGLTAAAICGVVAMFVPEVMGLGVETIDVILDNGYLLNFLLILLVLKMAVTSFAIGFGLFGGVFSPALFIGAAAGGFVANAISIFGLAVAPQLFVVAGMAAVAAAVVGAPIAVVLIVLEFTMSYEFAVAAMLSVVMATLLSSLLYGHSFFDEQLARRGIDLSQGRGNLELMNQPITSVVNDDFVALSPGLSVKAAVKLLAKANSSEGYCLGEANNFVGKFSLQQLLLARQSDKIKAHLMINPVILNHDASVMQAIEVASNFVGEAIPVVDYSKNEFLGVVTEANIFQAYLSTQSRIHDLEHS
ncbi:MAG: chloride channel protein [Marinovum sp.]|nr:chloride channel protein [Marinovum sp.]